MGKLVIIVSIGRVSVFIKMSFIHIFHTLIHRLEEDKLKSGLVKPFFRLEDKRRMRDMFSFKTTQLCLSKHKTALEVLLGRGPRRGCRRFFKAPRGEDTMIMRHKAQRTANWGRRAFQRTGHCSEVIGNTSLRVGLRHKSGNPGNQNGFLSRTRH
mgnify:CR=1 FL=1